LSADEGHRGRLIEARHDRSDSEIVVHHRRCLAEGRLHRGCDEGDSGKTAEEGAPIRHYCRSSFLPQ
jgi:hypothetical protein